MRKKDTWKDWVRNIGIVIGLTIVTAVLGYVIIMVQINGL